MSQKTIGEIFASDPASTPLVGTEVVELETAGGATKATELDSLRDFVKGEGIANTVTITGEHWFTEDNELDYSSSIVHGMSAATITFTELPSDTLGIFVHVDLEDTGANVQLANKRSVGGTHRNDIRINFADVGTNKILGTYWLPTESNTLYVVAVAADSVSNFIILGYKTGA